MNQFGGGSQFGGGGSDEYGFFTAPRATGVTNEFGASPSAVGAPVGAFGGPPALTSTPAPPSGAARAGKVVGLVGLVAVLVVGAWFGWRAHQLSQPLVVPPTLSALSPVEGAKAAQLKADLVQEWQQENPGRKLAVEVYSGHKQTIILAMTRGKIDVKKDFADAGLTGDVLPVGHAQCAAAPGLVACERSSSTLSALVMEIGGTAQEANAALNEAWELQ